MCYWEAVKTAGLDSHFKNLIANLSIPWEDSNVTMSMRSPHTPSKDIATYLQRFCTMVKDPIWIHVANSFLTGTWTVVEG